MPAWEEYKKVAQERGALAMELYVVESTPMSTPDALKAALPDHLAYQSEQEAAGSLFLAGPMSDATGEEMKGNGLIIYRAASMDDAIKLAEADPMHRRGVRSYTIRKWLINEGSLSLGVSLSKQSLSFS